MAKTSTQDLSVLNQIFEIFLKNSKPQNILRRKKRFNAKLHTDGLPKPKGFPKNFLCVSKDLENDLVCTQRGFASLQHESFVNKLVVKCKILALSGKMAYSLLALDSSERAVEEKCF